MKWRFSCHVCGQGYELEHKSIHKDAFYGMKKEGRPMIDCASCDLEGAKTMIVGDMLGGRK